MLRGVLTFQEELKIRWKIDGFFKLPGIVVIESPSFFWRSHEYIILCNKSIACNVCEVIIECKDRKHKETSQFIINVENDDGYWFNRDSIPVQNDYCFKATFYKDKPLYFKDKLTKDGSLTIIITVFSTQNTSKNVNSPKGFLDNSSQDVSTQTVRLESVETLSENFKAILSSGQYADVKIKVKNREFQAHKTVLAARSPVFYSMFLNDMMENNSGILNITDCEEDVFEGFLTFLYSGMIDQVHSSKISALYEISDKYDIPELMKQCVKRLVVEMSVELVCDALRVATLHEEKDLLETATRFFIDNAKDVLDTLKWKTFLKEHHEIANELFIEFVKNRKRNEIV